MEDVRVEVFQKSAYAIQSLQIEEGLELTHEVTFYVESAAESLGCQGWWPRSV